MVETDDLTFRSCGESVYMACCKNVKKGAQLKMQFTFKNWDATGAGSK